MPTAKSSAAMSCRHAQAIDRKGQGEGAGMVRVAIALGSNLGRRRTNLDAAIHELEHDLRDIARSSFIETKPVGVPSSQPDYLNAAIVGTTELPPRALLTRLLEVERIFGRVRNEPLAARTLDLDLILYGDAVIEDEGLLVPHPRFRERSFVLAPLAEIAPELVDPVTRKTVSELLQRLGTTNPTHATRT